MSTGKTYYGIAMGDPAGIGPEIALKAVNRSTANRNSVIIYGSEVVLRQCHQQLGIEAPLKVITQPGEFEKGCINMIAAASIDADEVVVGQASAATGQAARASIARAVQDALAGKIGVVTTAPVSMPAIAAGTDDVNSLETLFASMDCNVVVSGICLFDLSLSVQVLSFLTAIVYVLLSLLSSEC